MATLEVVRLAESRSKQGETEELEELEELGALKPPPRSPVTRN
jgi:hypothetical protein